MSEMLSAAAREGLLERGYSRRNLGRIASLLGTGLALNTGIPKSHAYPVASLPSADIASFTRIDTNECWTGPFPEAAQSGASVVFESNRYDPTGRLRAELIKTAANVEHLAEDTILPWVGSSDPLCRAIVTFCSPTRGLVTADPTYEAGWVAAEWMKVPLAKVPLDATKGYRADVRAMLRANPQAGVYYICNPNNPTGTLTPLSDIAWLLANKPKGSIVLVDEAYIHFSDTPSAVSFVRAQKDIIVLRTFSKMFGMAGLRLGFSITRPDLHQKMMRYDGDSATGMLAIPAVACGTKSLTMTSAIAERRQTMISARTLLCNHLKKRGLRYIPSEANMVVIDWKRPVAPIKKAFFQQKILIGRSWPIWPQASRITVGSVTDMTRFCTALDRIMT